MEHLTALHNTKDHQIAREIKNGGFLTRPNASNGWRLCFYLSLCLPQARSLFLLPSLFLVLHPPPGLSISFLRTLLECLTHTCFVYLTMGFDSQQGILFGIATTALFTLLYPWCLKFALRVCPKSFTFGEASLVVQGLMMFIYQALLNVYHSTINIPTSQYDIITLILQLGILFVLLVVWTLYKLSPVVDLKTFLCVVGVYITLLLILLHVLLGQSSIIWMIAFLWEDDTRLRLLIFWSVASLLGATAVFGMIFTGSKASTSQRKVFHILCSAVYLTGYIWDVHLTYLASGIALAVLIALETMRKLHIGDVSVFLNEGFTLFADEKDAGISLTPLYLLVGLSLPLALRPISSLSLLTCLSGVLSIGIGDTFASYVGSKFGKTQWPGTSKSVEGTFASVAAQLCTVTLLMYCGFLDITLWKTLICILGVTINSIEEALTDQVDNLSLPFITFFVLNLCH